MVSITDRLHAIELIEEVVLVVVVHLLCLLESLKAQFGLVFPRYVSPHRVVSREGPRAEGARHADSLVPLSYMCPQICFVAVESLAEWAFQFFTIRCANTARLPEFALYRVPHTSRNNLLVPVRVER